MDSEKFNTVLEYFNSEGITLPTDVRNAIEDVFLENDAVENVTCYFQDELDSFQNDLKFKNQIKIYTNGQSTGIIHNTFTYYGQVDFSVSEETTLLEKNGESEAVIEGITNIDNNDIPTLVYDSSEYDVVLLETLIWNTPNAPTRTSQLFIYCPEDK